MARPTSMPGGSETARDAESLEHTAHWSLDELASFASHPGLGRVLAVRPGTPEPNEVEHCLRSAGYCTGRLPITRDPSHLPQAAATFMPDVIYVTLTEPLSLCLNALEALASDSLTQQLPIVAILAPGMDDRVIDEAYTRSGCDFFRLGASQIELLARTHLLVRLAGARDDRSPLHSRPIPEAANAPTGTRLDLLDGSLAAYSPTYLRHRLPLETARAHRYQRALSLVALRCPGAAHDDEIAATVGRAIADSVRDVDLVARLEPDLLIVLLPETDERGAAILAERVASTLSGRKIPHSCGTATLGTHDDAAHSPAGLLRLACRRADSLHT